MNLTNANPKHLELLSRLYSALSALTSFGVGDDPVLLPSCRAALRIRLDRLYTALNDDPLDSLDREGDSRFRTLAVKAALHAEDILDQTAAGV